MSAQQTLTLPLPVQKYYGSWVRHPEVELASSRVALWFVKGGLLWLSSTEVAGKSHFVQALSKEHPQACFIDGEVGDGTSVQQLKSWLGSCQHYAYWILDLPSGELSPAKAYAVFHLIERAKEMNRSLMISWRCQEGEMNPPELRSRLLMMERVDMQAPIADEDLHAVLRSVLQTMQWDMKETVLPALLEYIPRDLAALLDAIKRLDEHSRQHQVKMNSALAIRVLSS